MSNISSASQAVVSFVHARPSRDTIAMRDVNARTASVVKMELVCQEHAVDHLMGLKPSFGEILNFLN